MQDEQRPDEEWLTVEQVAAELSITPNSVSRKIREGRLLGRKLDPTREKSPWYVARSELDRCLVSMQAQSQREQIRNQLRSTLVGQDYDAEARDATQERIASSLERIAVALERATPSLTLDHIVPHTWEANHHGC